jgi:energy-coupling factor transporter ATP-binding protein EcfA2
MIHSLQLKNFRRFGDHKLTFRQVTLLVGANNAGKSTIVEALRLVSIVANRYRVLPFRPPPPWLAEERAAPGVAPSLTGTGIDLSAVMNQYSDPPARIFATFTGGQSVEIYLGPDGEIHAVLRGTGGRLVRGPNRMRLGFV